MRELELNTALAADMTTAVSHNVAWLAKAAIFQHAQLACSLIVYGSWSWEFQLGTDMTTVVSYGVAMHCSAIVFQHSCMLCATYFHSVSNLILLVTACDLKRDAELI